MLAGAKGVGSGVYEYRIDFGPGYRIYFGKDGERLVILIGGGTKLVRLWTYSSTPPYAIKSDTSK